jgi:hypothetical protein
MRLVLPAALAFVLLAPAAFAQAQKPQGPQPATAPAKPYATVAVQLPTPFGDPDFAAFRKQLAEAAQKKDRAALEKLVVAQGFFWEAENGDKADRNKSGIDNLSAAVSLTGEDAYGWGLLGSYAGEATAAPYPGKSGVMCAPADPAFDEKALEELARSTRTDPGEWGYPLSENVEVRGANAAKAPVIGKLGLHFVRILPDADDDTSTPDQVPLVRIVTPSGKTGFVAADAIAPLGADQICYAKDAAGWKITGFVGTGEQ